jgi:hypothetical protein
MHIGYRWETQKERDHGEDQDMGGWTILKWIWLRIETSGGLKIETNRGLL